MRMVLMLAVLLGCNVPAFAQPQDSPPEAAAMLAETEGYGAWLIRLNAIEAPLLAELQRAGPEWSSAAQGWTERHRAGLRAYVARVVALVAETNGRLAALERPNFPGLDLGEELSTSALVETMIRNNRELQAVVEGMISLHMAGERNDRQAIMRASDPIMSGLRGVLRSQILLIRATQASTPPDHPYWHSAGFHLVFLRSSDRIVSAVPSLISGARDRTISADLRALATELEANARAGNEKADAMLALLREAEPNALGVDARALQQQIRLISITRANFPLSLEFAEHLRLTAAALNNGLISNADVGGLMGRYPDFRRRMDAITNAENEIVAGLN